MSTGSTAQLWTLLQTLPNLEAQRRVIADLHQRYRPFADSNFDVELPLEFGARFWEMYLGCAVLELGFDLVPQSRRLPAGPDLCIEWEGRRLWIEAIAPKAGEGLDAVPDFDEGDGWVPEQQIVLRYRAAVEEKRRKWDRYLHAGMTAATEPFVIAVNGFQIPNGHNIFPDEVPYPVQSVLPLGGPTVTVDVESGNIVGEGFETRWRIAKKCGTQVETAVFLDDAYGCISGLLFSGAHPFHVQGVHCDVLAFLHNPKASVPLPRGWLRTGMEYWVEGNRLLWARLRKGA